MRVTGPLIKVLNAMLSEPGSEVYGLELMRSTRVQSGTLYPILDRLESAGWVVARWEVSSLEPRRGPRRRYYRLTSNGAHEARQLLLEHQIAGGVAWT